MTHVNNFAFSIAGKYYLADFGYANRRGYLAPYRSINYHLCDCRWGSQEGDVQLPTNIHSHCRGKKFRHLEE